MYIANNIIISLGIILIIVIIFNNKYFNNGSKESFISNRIANNSQTGAFDKCYVINLQETKEGRRRWNIFLKHPILATHINRFQGIHGATYNYQPEINQNIINPKWDFGKWRNKSSKIIEMDPGEIGCILSHRNLWKRIVRENINCTLILEDDAISIKPKFLNIISNLKNHVPPNWDILLLGFWLHMGDNGKKINRHVYSVGNFCLLHSYMVSQKGARKLLRLGRIDKPLDSWISEKSDVLHIYRHNIIKKHTRYPTSSLISQYRKTKQIKNTNNW